MAVLCPLGIPGGELVFIVIERRPLRELIVLRRILTLFVCRYIDLRHLAVIWLVNLMIFNRRFPLELCTLLTLDARRSRFCLLLLLLSFGAAHNIIIFAMMINNGRAILPFLIIIFIIKNYFIQIT